MGGVVDGLLLIGGAEYAMSQLSVRNAIGTPMRLTSTLIAESQPLDLQSGDVPVVAYMNVGGAPDVHFTGETEEQSPGLDGDAEEFSRSLTARAPLSKTQGKLALGKMYGPTISGIGANPYLSDLYPASFSYSSSHTDIELVRALLNPFGIYPPVGDLLGAGIDPTIGVPLLNRATLRVDRSTGATLSAIRAIDEATDCYTIDHPDGAVIRRPWPYAGTPLGVFAESASGPEIPFFAPARWKESTAQRFDAAYVLGFVYPEGDPAYYNRPHAGLRTLAPANGVTWTPKEFSSDLLDTGELAGNAALNLMRRWNRMPRDITIDVEANRVYRVGDIYDLRCERLDIIVNTTHVIVSTTLNATESSAFYTLDLSPVAPGGEGSGVDMLPTVHAGASYTYEDLAPPASGSLITADVSASPTSLVSDPPFNMTYETDARTTKGSGLGLGNFRFVFLAADGSGIDGDCPATIRVTAEDPASRLRNFEDINGCGP